MTDLKRQTKRQIHCECMVPASEVLKALQTAGYDVPDPDGKRIDVGVSGEHLRLTWRESVPRGET